MVIATHALIGAVIGKNINNPYLIAGIALVSHFAFDTLRHGEYITLRSKLSEAWKSFLDLFIGIAIIAFSAYLNPLTDSQLKNMLIGIAFSIFPDSLTFFYWKMKCEFLKKLIDFHNWVHKYPRFSPERDWSLRNVRNDIIISLLAFSILILF